MNTYEEVAAKIDADYKAAAEWGKANSYSVTGVKTIMGMDGVAFNATIRKGGKKIGEAMDEGCGGCMFIDLGRQMDEAEAKHLEDFINGEVDRIETEKKEKAWVTRTGKKMAKKGFHFLAFWREGAEMSAVGCRHLADAKAKIEGKEDGKVFFF